MIHFVASEQEAGARVDAVIASRAGLPRSRVQEALKSGAVTVGGARVRPSHRLSAGEMVAGDLAAAEVEPPGGEAIPVDIVYEDERVLVVDKPAGLATHPGAGRTSGTLINALLGLGTELALMGSERPGIVHRLDKDTSGVLLVAKDDDAHAYLAAELKARRITRTYDALVRGATPATGTIEAALARHPTNPRKFAVTAGGRDAITHYRRRDANDEATLLEVTLETGRTHQIRVHLAWIGHPVMGDATYGGVSEVSRRWGLKRPFLHAKRLVFPHPEDGRPREALSPLPPDLVAALGAAGLEAR